MPSKSNPGWLKTIHFEFLLEKNIYTGDYKNFNYFDPVLYFKFLLIRIFFFYCRGTNYTWSYEKHSYC